MCTAPPSSDLDLNQDCEMPKHQHNQLFMWRIHRFSICAVTTKRTQREYFVVTAPTLWQQKKTPVTILLSRHQLTPWRQKSTKFCRHGTGRRRDDKNQQDFANRSVPWRQNFANRSEEHRMLQTRRTMKQTWRRQRLSWLRLFVCVRTSNQRQSLNIR